MTTPDINKVKAALAKYTGFQPRTSGTSREPEDAHRRKYVKSFGDTCRKGFRDPNFFHCIR